MMKIHDFSLVFHENLWKICENVSLGLLGARGVVVQPRNVVRAVLVDGRDLDVVPCIVVSVVPGMLPRQSERSNTLHVIDRLLAQ